VSSLSPRCSRRRRRQRLAVAPYCVLLVHSEVRHRAQSSARSFPRGLHGPGRLCGCHILRREISLWAHRASRARSSRQVTRATTSPRPAARHLTRLRMRLPGGWGGGNDIGSPRRLEVARYRCRCCPCIPWSLVARRMAPDGSSYGHASAQTLQHRQRSAPNTEAAYALDRCGSISGSTVGATGVRSQGGDPFCW